MDLRILLTHEGANYLREWAENIPIAIEDITASTERVVTVYQSVSESVGPHRESFYQMILHIKKVQEESVEPLYQFHTGLKYTADKIDKYCDATDDGTDSPQKTLTLHK